MSALRQSTMRTRILADPYGEYLAYVQREKAPRTFESYAKTLRAFREDFPDPFEAEPADVEAWTARERSRGGITHPASPLTRRKETATLKGFYRYCTERAGTDNPMRDVRIPKKPVRVASKAVDRRLLNEAIATERLPHRRLALLLMCDAGLRAEEPKSRRGLHPARQRGPHQERQELPAVRRRSG